MVLSGMTMKLLNSSSRKAFPSGEVMMQGGGVICRRKGNFAAMSPSALNFITAVLDVGI
jgi:hypothetical protein